MDKRTPDPADRKPRILRPTPAWARFCDATGSERAALARRLPTPAAEPGARIPALTQPWLGRGDRRLWVTPPPDPIVSDEEEEDT